MGAKCWPIVVHEAYCWPVLLARPTVVLLLLLTIRTVFSSQRLATLAAIGLHTSDTGATSSDLPAANQHATHSTRGPHARPIWSLGPGRERGKHFCRPSGPSGGRSLRHAASLVRPCRGGWLHRERDLFGEEESSFGSKEKMIEERRRPGSARAGRHQEVRGGKGGERDGMDTPWHSCRSK